MTNCVYWYDSMWKHPKSEQKTIAKILSLLSQNLYSNCHLEHELGISSIGWGDGTLYETRDINDTRGGYHVVTQCYDSAFWRERDKPKLIILASFILGDIDKLINETIIPQKIPFVRYTRSSESRFSEVTLGNGYIHKPNLRALSREMIYWLKK